MNSSTNPQAKAPDNRADKQDEIDFGFRRVDVADHTGLVRGVFDSVARRYDLMNDLMSGGLHRVWKAALQDRLNPQPDMTLLDVAGGTGDVAEGFLKRGGGGAIICDINKEMLTAGMDRALDRGTAHGPARICGDAADLPVKSAGFQACTIAFGLRNVARRTDALAEMRRALQPGGHFICLEFSPPSCRRSSRSTTPILSRYCRGSASALRATRIRTPILRKAFASFRNPISWRPK
jgi:demethylmenaquinone methyltransferase/2-methoxy-6-polyprenyl-1,4-benzoquinol methylase